MKKRTAVLAILTLVFTCLLFSACESRNAVSVPGKDTPINGEQTTEQGNKYYTVTVDNAVTVTSGTYKEGTTVTLTAPEIEYKLFDCWYYQGKKASEEKTYEFTVEENAAVRAVYVDSYTVFLDAGEGKIDCDKIIVGENRSFTVPVPVREHFTFLCWKRNSREMTDEKGNSLVGYDYDKDITLVACYEEDEKFTVTEIVGETRTETTYYKGEEVILMAKDFTSVGKKFISWYKITVDDNGEETAAAVGEGRNYTFTVTENAVFEARYKISFTVELYIGSSVKIIECDEGMPTVISVGTIPEGKRFVKWINSDTGEEVSTEETFEYVASKNACFTAILEDIV